MNYFGISKRRKKWLIESPRTDPAARARDPRSPESQPRGGGRLTDPRPARMVDSLLRRRGRSSHLTIIRTMRTMQPGPADLTEDCDLLAQLTSSRRGRDPPRAERGRKRVRWGRCSRVSDREHELKDAQREPALRRKSRVDRRGSSREASGRRSRRGTGGGERIPSGQEVQPSNRDPRIA